MIDAKQYEILGAAIRVFARLGSATTIKEIAKEADVEPITVHRLCESREHIILMMYEMLENKIYEVVDAVTHGPFSEYNAIDKIKQIIDALKMFFFLKKDLVLAIIKNPIPSIEDLNTDNNDKDKTKITGLQTKRQYVREQHRNALRLIDKIIEEGQSKKEIKSDLKPQIIRQMLIGVFVFLLYGIAQFNNERETIGFSLIEAEKGMNFLLNAISTMGSDDVEK